MRRSLLSLLVLLTAFPLSAAITGVVVNGDGQPVAGAKVSIFAPESIEARRERLVSNAPDRKPIASMTPGSKGTFTFDSPKDEPVVELDIEANGFAPEALRLLADDDAGAVALTPAAPRLGTITAAGKPVAGATVIWMGDTADVITRTDAQGHYSVPDPAKWANHLTVIHPDFAVLQEVMRPNAVKLDHSLEEGVRVTGRVVAQDGKTPVAKADLRIDDLPLATTGDDGTFTISAAPANWEEIEARGGNAGGLRARAGKGALSIRMAPLAVISGSVSDAKSRLPLVDAEVRLLPESQMGGRIRGRGLFGPFGSQVFGAALTDSKGRFTLTVVPGRYTLAAAYPGSEISHASVSVTAGQTANRTLWATANARVSGTIVDEARRPLAGARVAFRDANRGGRFMIVMGGRTSPDLAAISGPDGRFSLRNVTPDTDVRLDATRKGFPSAESATLHLASGERKSGIMMTIVQGVALSGKVTDPDGRPLSGVAVRPVQSEGGGMRGFAVRRVIMTMTFSDDDDIVKTGSDGTFTVHVKPGTYDIVFKREGFATKTLRGEAINATTEPVSVKLDPGVEISGRVTRSGAGVEGVAVNAISEDANANTVTAGDGSFTLTDLTPGSMMLNVRKPDEFIQQNRPVTAPARDVVIDLPPGGRITGHVLDKNSHAPVTSFQAGISGERSGGGMVIMMPPMLKTFTNDDGSFTLEHVPPGPTQVVVTAAGYTTQRIPGLNVENGKALPDLEVDMESGANLSGRVTGPDGGPLSGVSVRFDQGATRVISFGTGPSNATTDPDGQYTIDSLEPGDKTFTFSKQGYVSETRDVNVTGTDTRLDVQLSTGLTVSGTVVTEAGVPVADASVGAFSASDGSFSRQTRTDSNGSFQFSGLAPGHYSMVASKQGLAQGRLNDFDVSAGAPARIVMKIGGTITGHVSGLTDAELRQAIVTATSTNGNASADVDAGGNYRIDGAPSGSVRVSARTSAAFAGEMKMSAPKTVQIDPGSSAQVDIDFTSNTVVRGRVTQNGQPMAGAIVTFFPNGSGAQTAASGTTDNDGTYQISGLQDGTYNVSVRDMSRVVGFSSNYTVSGSGTYDIDIKSVSVRGRVLDSSTGAPVPGAQVELRQNGAGGPMSSRVAQTDPSGAFVVDNVQNGAYTAIAQKDGYGQQTRTFTVADVPPDDLELKIARSDGVTLRVVDERDSRLLSANVTRVIDAQGNNVQDMGGFRFGGGPTPIKLNLAPGQYTVTVMAMGYAPRVVTVTSPSTQTIALTAGVTLTLRSAANASRRVRLVGSDGTVFPRGIDGIFGIDAAPATVTLSNVAPGNYTLQVLDPAGNIAKSIPVTVVAGQDNVMDV